MKAHLFTLEPGDRFRFTKERTVYKVQKTDFSDDHGIEVVFVHLVTEKSYLAKGHQAMNEIVLIN